MKNKKYLVGEGTVIWYSSETSKEFKCKTIPTDIDEAHRGYGCIKNADKTQADEGRKINQ